MLDEVAIAPISGKQPIVTEKGKIKEMFTILFEYDENMQLCFVLAIVSCIT